MNPFLLSFLDRLSAPSSEGAVLYSRVLIRRDLDGRVFPCKASDAESAAVSALVERLLRDSGDFDIISLTDASTLDRRVAVERDLIPQAYAVQGTGFMAASRASPVWCTVNETDHLRIRAERPGPDIRGAYKAALDVQERLGEAIDYAFSPETGYLCAEIADWGTGLSASATLHLPALAMAGLVDRALRAALDSGLSVRGFWSDESVSSGALYELETPRGLWVDEESLLDRLSDAAERISAYEKGARDELLAHDPEAVRDAVFRAYGTARFARRVGYDEGAETLSRLRLGAASGMLSGYDGESGARGFYALRNAHLLHYRKGREPAESEDTLESVRVEQLRAASLRSLVSSVSILEVP